MMKSNFERRLTRREFTYLAIGLTGTSALGLTGCGGLFSGSKSFDGINSLVRVRGTLMLPGGLLASQLEAFGSGATGSLTETSFQVEVQESFPSMVTLWDPASKRAVLFSMIDSAAPDQQISPTSTASTILFLGLGGMDLNSTDRRNLLQRIESSNSLISLTAALSTALASDPFAVTTAPQPLKDAIKASVTDLSRGIREQSSGANNLGRSSEFPPLLTLEPSNSVDGLTFVQGSVAGTYLVQNERRRYGRVFTYVTGHVNDNNVETSENPPSLSGGALDIPTTVGLLNTTGKGWSQVTSAAVTLPVVGQDKKTKYQMVALTPVFGAAEPAIYRDPRYANEVDKWKDETANLRGSVMLAGVMELALEILGLGGAAMGYTTLQGALAGLLSTGQVIRQAMSAAFLGNVFYGQVISEFAASMTFEEIFLAEMPLLEALTVKIKSDLAANAVRNAFLRPRLLVARAALVAIVALGVVELADIIAIAKDTNSGNEANVWSGLVFQPEIGMSASADGYSPGAKVVFTVQVPTTSATLLYRWKASGSNLIVLDDGVTFNKLEFDSQKNVTTLSTTPSTVGDLTVTCEVFDVTGGQRNLLGATSKKVTFSEANPAVLDFATYISAVVLDDGGNGKNDRKNFCVFSIASFIARAGYRYVVTYGSNSILDSSYPASDFKDTVAVMDPAAASTLPQGGLTVPIFNAPFLPGTADQRLKLYNLGGGRYGFVANNQPGLTFGNPNDLIPQLTANLNTNIANSKIKIEEIAVV